jgi:hypothetical protein
MCVLTWRARHDFEDGKKAIKVLDEWVMPSLLGTGYLAGMDEKLNKLKQAKLDYTMEEQYVEFVSDLYGAVEKGGISKSMKGKPAYKKIGPYTAYYLDKYALEINAGIIFASVIATMILKNPAPAAAAVAGEEIAAQQVAKKLGLSVIKQFISKNLTFSNILTMSTYPFIAGGVVVGIDGMANYFLANNPLEKDQAIEQIRSATILLSYGVGTKAFVLKGPLLKTAPTIANTVFSVTSQGLMFGGVGISAFERFKGEGIDWVGLAGDAAFFTIGTLSLVRTVKGFKTAKTADIAGKSMKKGLPAFVVSGLKKAKKAAIAGEISVFIGGTTIYFSEGLGAENKETIAVKTMLEATPKMKAVKFAFPEDKKAVMLQVAKESADLIVSLIPQMSEDEIKEMHNDQVERTITRVLFPDIFKKYYYSDSSSSPKEIRNAVVKELCKQVGMPESDNVFIYLLGQMTIFETNPDAIKKANEKVYNLFDQKKDAIPDALETIKRWR